MHNNHILMLLVANKQRIKKPKDGSEAKKGGM